MNPSIPTEPCFKCGVPTNETSSVHGVGHYKCFINPADLSFADDDHPYWIAPQELVERQKTRERLGIELYELPESIADGTPLEPCGDDEYKEFMAIARMGA